MRVKVVQCGPIANESERKAIEQLKLGLRSEDGDDEWILLTNVAFSVNHQLQSDEIDIIAIGPPGVRVIEVKHWAYEWVRLRNYDVMAAADLVTSKARKVGTTLRRQFPQLPHVAGAFLLTQEPSKLKRLSGEVIKGVCLHTLNGWKESIGLSAQAILKPADVRLISQYLEPRSPVAIDGSLRRLAGYVNLELRSPKEQRFHREYQGSHPTRRDRVVLHLYDLSASDNKNPEAKARREFEALHRLQLHPWAPRILDSFQEAAGYAGEMFIFTVVDPAAPSLSQRAEDKTWSTADRAEFARNAVKALSELHSVQADGVPLVHRNITPDTILVRFDNSSILTGFDRTKIASDLSVASTGSAMIASVGSMTPPEVLSQGPTAADCRSDVYSLCCSLMVLFNDATDQVGRRAIEILKEGTHAEPVRRGELNDLYDNLSELLGHDVPRAEAPPAQYWTEGQTVSFHERDYRLVNRLGSGGVGTTFKVVEVDRDTKADVGTFVAKVAHGGELDTKILMSYRLARPHLGGNAGLSTIFEVARQCQPNAFVALMKWIDGSPLAEFSGVFSLLAEEQEATATDLAIRWLCSVCDALEVLHSNSLVHGDVSPRNLIVSDGKVVLTDFDFVTKVGECSAAPGTLLYSSPSLEEPRVASKSDDFYALAASFFHVMYDREPFRHGGNIDKHNGLNWEGLDRDESIHLAEFLDRATNADPNQRFQTATEALASLERAVLPGKDAVRQAEKVISTGPIVETKALSPAAELTEQRIDWLQSLLESYPGSQLGNQETRGLDSRFSKSTYVETKLEATLLRDIRERQVRLVILCGNAGDGKTALLQHLAHKLGLGNHLSASRILEGNLPDGLRVRMNLDGSASWRGRSADNLLDEFLSPFQEGVPTKDIVHLLAINDGRLLEWVEGYGERHEGRLTKLPGQLEELLEGQPTCPTPHVRFISLNQRSLVGDVVDRKEITTDFLDRLIDQLYGGNNAQTIWQTCDSCSAKTRCEVYRAARLFGPAKLPIAAASELRHRARQRLFEALQAVHLQGETHITVRELRGALVYILFGLHFCDDYHKGSQGTGSTYWDRTFEATSPARQGDVLRELARFDPAWDTHPQIDRHLASRPTDGSTNTPPNYSDLPLESARRRAFFEWSRDDIAQIADDPESFGLARGRHLREFRLLPLMNPEGKIDLCRRICGGISRLADLPPKAIERPDVVPLRVTPRTPTETAFWIEKHLSSFRLEPDLPTAEEGIERLHRRAILIYRYRDNKEEQLRLGAELFHLLLELNNGYQLGDISSDDKFANLSIFVQRLVQEDARELFAWNPMSDETIYRIAAENRELSNGLQQFLSLEPLATGVQR